MSPEVMQLGATHYQWCIFTSHEAWGSTGARNQVVDSRLAYNRRCDRRIKNQSPETLRRCSSAHGNDILVILERRLRGKIRML